jgi:formylglycine-generating enzyme required for sulfatase activity/WD40 repeat protein/serine/threonine protein kinase
VIATTNDLLEFLQSQRLLSAEQLGVLAREKPLADARALARILVQRGWLTPYQVNELLLGRGQRLLLGSYVLLDLLGEGGMGQVFKARNWKLGQIVAVKLIRKERLTNPASIKRFYREIRAAAALEHPNIVRAIDADEVDGTHLFVMEFVEGTDLNKLVKTQGALDVRLACDYVRQAALGLQHAHERGLVHRDIKPHNLLEVSGGAIRSSSPPHHAPLSAHQIKILDMGLARIDRDADTDHSSTMTQEGTVMGTPDYIAPEQALDSHQVDIRADLYSLGCTLYFLLSGRVPFPGGEMMAKLLRHQNEDAQALESLRPEVSPAVSAIVRKLMAKRPENRFQTPAGLASALEGIKQHTTGERKASSTAGTVLDPKLARQWAAAVAPSSDTAALVKPPSQFVPATKKPLPLRWLAAGGGAVLVLLVLLLWQPWRRGGEHLNPDVNQPSKRKPSPEELARQEERKRQQEAEQAEKKRLADAEEALKPIAARVAALAAGASPAGDALRKELRDFLMKHSATPAATKACELLGQVLRKLPSPLDQLTAEQIPAYERRVAAGGRASAPAELVAVLGDSRLKHWHRVLSVAFSPDGKRIASGSVDSTAKVWDVATGQEILNLEAPGSWVYSVAFSPDAKWIVSAHGDGIVRVWDAETGQESKILKGHSAQVTSVAIDPKGKRIVSGSYDQTVKVWDAETGKEQLTFPKHTGKVNCVAYSPDGMFIVSGIENHDSQGKPLPGEVKIWNAETGKEVKTLQGRTAEITCLAFSKDSKKLATASLDGTAKIWDLASGKEILTLHANMRVSVAFSPDDQHIAVAGLEPTVTVYEIATGRPTLTLKGNATWIYCVAFSKVGNLLASGCEDGVVKIWDARTGEEIHQSKAHASQVDSVAFSPDDTCLASASWDQTAKVWDINTGQVKWTLNGHGRRVWCVTFSPDGKQIASGGHDAKVKLWDVDTGKENQSLAAHRGAVISLAFSPDAKQIASASEDQTVQLWNTASGNRTLTLSGHTEQVLGVAFSPDGRRIASTGLDRTLKIWDAQTGRNALNVNAHPQTNGGASLAYSPDGKWIVSADRDSTAKVWNAVTGKASHQLKGDPLSSYSVAFSPDGKLVAWAGSLGTVRLCDALTGAETQTFRLGPPLEAPIYQVAFAHDGRHLATANGNGSIYILRLADGPPRPLTAAEAKKQQEDEAKRLGVPVQINNSIGMKLNLIPAGRFLMGSPENEPGRRGNDGPRREVTISEPFLLGAYEVTQAEYEKVIGRNPSKFNKDNNGGPDHPVERVSWDDAVAFCKKLSEVPEEKKAGRVYRLPTEAEWEYAYRAGTQTAYPSGDDPKLLKEFAWFKDNANAHTHPVGKLKANAWGLHDMGGNVWEACADLYDPERIATLRNVRGGSFHQTESYGFLRAAHRQMLQQASAAEHVGFRVVCEYRPPQITNSIGMKLARIPAGKFLMGSPENEPGRKDDEHQHEVVLTKSLFMGVHEVTVGQFKAFVKETGYRTEAETSGHGAFRRFAEDGQSKSDPGASWRDPKFEQTDDHPVTCVSWNDALAFCNWLSKKEGKKYGLPTEAQWEYACRAGSQSRFYFGDKEAELTEHAWFWSNAGVKTHPVGAKMPNRWGLHDMVGNVWQWTADRYAADTYKKNPQTDPLGPDIGKNRVLRSAGWSQDVQHCRSAHRNSSDPSGCSTDTGFRLVCEVQSAKK